MRQRNLPLTLGLGILLMGLFVAVFGAAIAPRDPTEFNYVLDVGGQYVRPPFPAFVSGEFPLGSDPFGRDTLSQLLWAVRPTLILIGLVLLARVVMGVLLGMVAGWGSGRVARVIEGVTAAAMSVPVFIVALAAMAGLQAKLGVFAFVIGLAITGWAEMARVVREQTRLVKGQQFIEAARALGLSDGQIVLRHVVRQLVPVLTLTSSFEAANALLTLAALGFLGYFVGGSNWIMISDFGARRVSGLPELGQMLATSASQRADSTAMLLTGAAVALLVAGFMLTGEGLRLRLAQEARRRSQFANTVNAFIEEQRVEQRVYDALTQRKVRWRIASGIAAVVLLGAGVAVWQLAKPPVRAPVALVPGGHAWSGERRDPAGTLRTASELDNSAAPDLLWTFDAKATLVGGPAISNDGTLYIGTRDNTVIAVNRDGSEKWRATLAAAPIGTPALGLKGEVYVADDKGNLQALSPDGQPLWTLDTGSQTAAIAGPVVDSVGNIFYPVDGAIVSATPEGKLRWHGSTLYTYFSPVVKLKQDSDDVFFKDIVISAKDGSLTLDESNDALDQFVTGEDGRMYLQSEHNLLEWQVNKIGIALVEVAKWDYTKRYPGVGVVEASVRADGSTWLLLGNAFVSSRLVWFRPGGELAGSVNFALSGGRVIAIGEQGPIYLCGRGKGAECTAFAFGSDQPLWQLALPLGREPVGGAMANSTLYVTTLEGKLFALGRRTTG